MHGPDPTEPVDVPKPPVRHRVRLALGIAAFVAAAIGLLAVDRPGVDSEMGRLVGQAAGGIPAPTVAVTPVTIPPLPIPEALPNNPYEDTPQVVVGSIEIPKIGITEDLQHGMSLTAINRGPGWWPGTAMPGELGNVVVAGHRTSHHAEFLHLDDLAPGDEVIMTTLAGRFVYRIVGVEIVAPDAIWIVDQTPARTATLFACHPPGSISERIVAHLELVA